MLARALAPGDAARRRRAAQRGCATPLEQLGAHPRDRKFRDAIWHTYIEPMHKQEQVAAELGVPFATYRYRLQQGIERIAAALQAADSGGARGARFHQRFSSVCAGAHRGAHLRWLRPFTSELHMHRDPLLT